jgi:dienelactone hydrolase
MTTSLILSLAGACTSGGGDDSSADAATSTSDHDTGASSATETADADEDTDEDADEDTTGTPSDLSGDLPPDEPGSRCEQTPTSVVCPKLTIELGPWQRDVHYQVPLGEPPAAGWPVVLMFQGSFFSAELTWTAIESMPFGGFHQTLVVAQLLDHGYAVITPETKLDGGTFWDTNIPPYSINWESSKDHLLMLEIFEAIEAGTFGPLDASTLFATGVSSGGYMSSRVALAYPGRFRAIAIAAASYMTCSGPLCNVPELQPAHPPTLFLHGEVDTTVPLWTAEDYYVALLTAGVDTQMVLDSDESHGWIPASPDEVLAWFEAHP